MSCFFLILSILPPSVAENQSLDYSTATLQKPWRLQLLDHSVDLIARHLTADSGLSSTTFLD